MNTPHDIIRAPRATQSLEAEASNTIAALNAAGQKREASRLGDLLGVHRRGRIGDSMLRNAVNAASRLLS